jgi:hypothetical protein
MHRVFETVQPEELVVGDVVKGNGALWVILSFGRWGMANRPDGRPEFVTVECIDPCGVAPFKVGFCKQFALYPRGDGTWDRETREADVDLRKFTAGIAVEDAEGHRGQVFDVAGAHKVRVAWHKGYSSIEDVAKLRIVEDQEQ